MKFRAKRLLVSSMWIANTIVVLAFMFVAYSGHISPLQCKYFACVPMLLLPMFMFMLLFGVVISLFKPKYFLLQIFAMAMCFQQIKAELPIHLFSSEPKAEKCGQYIKVLSFNTMGFGGADENNEDNEIVDYIAKCNADIVCLQESNSPSIAEYEYQQKKLSFYKYTSAIDIVDADVCNRLLCYSKYPIIYINKVYYHSKSNGSIMLKLLVDGDTVVVINNHFESNKLTVQDKATYKNMIKEHNVDSIEDGSRMLLSKLSNASRRRAGQVDTVRTLIDSLRQQYPLIVCGDFNDPPNSYTHYTIGSDLIDCYASAGTGLGVSYNQRGFFFRIDNIMVNKMWSVEYCKVDNSIDKSDHYPIFAYLKRRK